MPKRLSQEAISQIKSRASLKGLLAEQEDVEISTIDRWLKENTKDLTTADVLDFLKKHTGLKKKDLLAEIHPADMPVRVTNSAKK